MYAEETRTWNLRCTFLRVKCRNKRTCVMTMSSWNRIWTDEKKKKKKKKAHIVLCFVILGRRLSFNSRSMIQTSLRVYLTWCTRMSIDLRHDGSNFSLPLSLISSCSSRRVVQLSSRHRMLHIGTFHSKRICSIVC